MNYSINGYGTRALLDKQIRAVRLSGTIRGLVEWRLVSSFAIYVKYIYIAREKERKCFLHVKIKRYFEESEVDAALRTNCCPCTCPFNLYSF